MQGLLEPAISEIANETVQLTVAGRTDSGVHASQQIVGFSSTTARPKQAWINGVNSKLSDDVAVIWAADVPSSFNARHSALWRRYVYIYGNVESRQVFTRDLATWVDESFDTTRMNSAAEAFLGEKDFSAVRAAACSSRSPCRYVYTLHVHQVGHFVVIDVVANAFLMHMVRNIAAVLRAVGTGKMSATDCVELLNTRDRTQAPPTASPAGLYLVEVGYEAKYKLNFGARVPAILHGTSQSFDSVILPQDHYRNAYQT